MKKHLLKIVLLVCCLVGGNVGAWADAIETIGTRDASTGECTGTYNVTNSQTYALAQGESYHFSFVNYNSITYNSTVGNWQNWVLFCSDGTNSIFALRADNWEDIAGSSSDCSSNFNWDTFRTDMDGATVDMDVKFIGTTITVSSTIITAAGTKYAYSYTKSSVSVTSVNLYFSVNASQIVLNEATKSELTTYTLSIHGVDASNNDLGEIATYDNAYDGLSVTVGCPKYLTDANGKVTYVINGSNSQTVTASSTGCTVLYNAYTGIAYFVEAEKVITGCYDYSNAKLSSGHGSYGGKFTTNPYSIITVPETGIYTVKYGAFTRNTRQDGYVYIYNGDTQVVTSANIQNSINNYQEFSSANLSFAADDVVKMQASSTNIVVDYILLEKLIIGAADKSTGYRGVKGSDVKLAKGDRYYVKFQNHGSSDAVYKNWLMDITSGSDLVTTLRADWYAFGVGSFTNAYSFSTDGGATKSTGNVWDTFSTDMTDATVELTASYSTEGVLSVVGTMTNGNDVYYYNYSVSEYTDSKTALADNITLNLSVENAYLEILEEETYSYITLNSEKTYTTYCNATRSLDFTDNADVEAYTAIYDEDNEGVVLTQVYKVPAGAGVILKNLKSASSASVNVVSSADALTDNELVGVTAATDLSYSAASKYNYILATVEGVQAFHPVSSGTIAAGKAYLSTTYDCGYSTGSAKALNIVFADDATAIKSVSNSVNNGAVYNLTGQRVAANAKGIVIINGKKYLNK